MSKLINGGMKLMNDALGWIDDRFPLTKTWNEHLAQYYAPKNFNFWYYFGSLALVVLVIQIVTGIWLTMNYKPSAEHAFSSVEYIMRDVDWGWWIRYMHSTGSSAFFIVIYLHMFRGMMYGSYKRPRELLWLTGMFIYLILMAEAFFGYLLPWGQMSYWGAQVIISLFGAIPFVGPELAEWIRGDYVVSDVTLNRFFSYHASTILLGIDCQYSIDWNINYKSPATEPGREINPFILKGNLLNCGWCNVQDYLTIPDMLLRNFNTFDICIDKKKRCHLVIDNPFIQCPDEVGLI